MLVSFKNPDISQNQKTYLSAGYDPATTSVDVESTAGFAVDDYIVVGKMGAEKTELRKISAITDDNTLGIDALDYSHAHGTEITLMYFNQIDIQYKTSSAGSATPISGMPVALQVDRLDTQYNHETGATTYYYRARFYNSTGAVYSDWSVWFPAAGLSRRSLDSMIKLAYKLAHDTEQRVFDRDEVIQLLNDGQDDVESRRKHWFFTLVRDMTSLTTTAGSRQVTLPSDFKRMRHLYFHKDDGTNEYIYPLRYIPEIIFQHKISDQSADSSDDVLGYTLVAGDSTNPQGYIFLNPAPTTAGLYVPIEYHKDLADLVDPDDLTDVPIPRVLVDYAVSHFYLAREKFNEAERWELKYERGIDKIKQLEKRMAGQPDFLTPYGGRRGHLKFYGDMGVTTDIDTLRENYW
jgi:hypothetical protein